MWFRPTILSRFDAIFVVKDVHDVVKDAVWRSWLHCISTTNALIHIGFSNWQSMWSLFTSMHTNSNYQCHSRNMESCRWTFSESSLPMREQIVRHDFRLKLGKSWTLKFWNLYLISWGIICSCFSEKLVNNYVKLRNPAKITGDGHRSKSQPFIWTIDANPLYLF